MLQESRRADLKAENELLLVPIGPLSSIVFAV